MPSTRRTTRSSAKEEERPPTPARTSRSATSTKGSNQRTPAGGEEVSASETVSVNSGGGSSTATSITRSRLPHWVEKQLAEDIESCGGLKGFDSGKTQGIRELCDHRTYTLEQPEFYGEVGSEQRRKISQKVTKWKKLPETEYLQKLAFFQVTPYKQRMKQGKSKLEKAKTRVKNPPSNISTSVDDLSLDISVLSIDGGEEQPTPTKKPTTKVPQQKLPKKQPSNVSLDDQSEVAAKQESKPKKMAAASDKGTCRLSSQPRPSCL